MGLSNKWEEGRKLAGVGRGEGGIKSRGRGGKWEMGEEEGRRDS